MDQTSVLLKYEVLLGIFKQMADWSLVASHNSINL